MSNRLDLSPILLSPDFEGTETLPVTAGRLPDDLCGTYYLNGPGHFQLGDFRYRHWLDGDGYVRALRFRGGRAELTAKYVRTKKFQTEEAAGKPVFRAFGTAFADDRLRLRMAIETPANVSLWPFGGKLLAFGEQALPWELDNETLDTVGECNFKKAFNAITPFSAHPKIDRKGGRLCNFGIKYMMRQANLCYWEFDEAYDCRVNVELPLDHSYSVHDFMVSADHVALYLSPYYLNSEEVVRGGKSIHDALEWKPEDPNRLLVFPRNSPFETPVEIVTGHRGYCLHTIDAIDTDSSLVLDILETSEPLYLQYLPLPALFETIKACRFTRLEIDKASWKLLTVSSFETGCHLDFPVVLERDVERRQVWALGMPVEPAGESKYYNRILRFSWDSGSVVDEYRAPEGSYLAGEPSMAEMSSGNNYLICPEWESRSNTGAFLILDPHDLATGPLARLQSAHPGNLGFHSTFQPA